MSGRRALPFHRQSADSMPQESRAPSVSENGSVTCPPKRKPRAAWKPRVEMTLCKVLSQGRERVDPEEKMATSAKIQGALACGARVTMRALAVTCLIAAGSGASARAQEGKHPVTFEDMMRMHRTGEPQISPDGKWVAYTVATPDFDANRNASNIWIAPVSGGEALQLTRAARIRRRCGRRTARQLPFSRRG